MFLRGREALNGAVKKMPKGYAPLRTCSSDGRPRWRRVSAQVVLIVDRDVDTSNSLAMLLETELPQLTVLPSTTVSHALDILRQRPVALVIADYRLGTINGLDFLVAVRERQPDAKTILLTSSIEDDVFRNDKRGLVDRLFVKPLDHIELLRSVDELSREPKTLPSSLFAKRPGNWAAP